MAHRNFTTTFSVKQSPQEVFDAINDVRAWWSGEIEGRTDTLGAEFTYRYKDLHRTTQRITELVPGKKVVWHIVDSYIGFVEDTTEWNGTDVVFEIEGKRDESDGGDGSDETEVRFTHVGLVPAIPCYGGCSSAWSFYVNDSLRKLITAAKASPTRRKSVVAGEPWPTTC